MGELACLTVVLGCGGRWFCDGRDCWRVLWTGLLACCPHCGKRSASAGLAPSGVASLAVVTSHQGRAVGGAWMLWLALLAVFLGLGGVVATLAMPSYVAPPTSGRVDPGLRDRHRIQPSRRAVDGELDQRQPDQPGRQGDGQSNVNTAKTQRLLERADLPLRPGEWAVLRVVAIVVGVAGGVILMHGGSISTFIGSCLGALVGVVGPALFLKFAASRRSKKFEAQLPDVLTLVASSLSTGFSLLQALDAVARDAAEPSAKEFSRALAETRIGADLNESLDHLADRMESINLRWTAMAINIQRQVGGNLAETLRNTAATLRDRESLRRHVNALSAEGKLSAYILIALPIGVFLYMLVGKPGVCRAALDHHDRDRDARRHGLVSMAFGIFWMRKVVKVEV